MKTVFALSSWGNAGVPWICQCINLHRSIHAWSCMNFAPHTVIGRDLDPIEYLDAIARLGWCDYAAAGDVHGVTSDKFDEVRKAFGDKFRGGHLIAHPVPRFAGSLAFSKVAGRDWKHADFLAIRHLDRAHPVAVQARALVGENGDHVPVNYIMNVNSVSQIYGTADPLFRLEDLMTRTEAWDAMVRHLSGGLVADYGDTWRALEGVYVGVAHEPFALKDPAAVWRGLPELARTVFSHMLSDDARRIFGALGYDLSFVPTRSSGRPR